MVKSRNLGDHYNVVQFQISVVQTFAVKEIWYKFMHILIMEYDQLIVHVPLYSCKTCFLNNACGTLIIPSPSSAFFS